MIKKKILSVLTVMLFVVICVIISACAKEETKYNITIDTLQNGTATASQTSANAGEIITLTVTPNSGYNLRADTLKQNENALTVTAGSAIFTMPTANVIITATFDSESVATTFTVTFNLNGGTHSGG